MSLPSISEAQCYIELIIALLIMILYLYAHRKKIIYTIKHRRLPEKQMRVCPGCGSTILIPLGPDNVKCNDCGAIFATSRSVVKAYKK